MRADERHMGHAPSRDLLFLSHGSRPCREVLLIALAVTIWWTGLRSAVVAQQASQEYRFGMIATLHDQHGNRCRRIDERIAFDWGNRAADPRIGHPFHVSWNGYLLVQKPGSYRLHLRVAGTARVHLQGRVVVQAAVDGPARWYSTAEVDLAFGWHPLEVEFEKTGADAQIKLFWTGPGFSLEPVTPRYLFHDPKRTPPPAFERGKQLTSALRCAACHLIPGAPAAQPAPALDRLPGNVTHEWLVDWLANSPPVPREEEHPAEVVRRMPGYAFDRSAAQELAAYLQSVSPVSVAGAKLKGDVAAGKKLFLSVGCLACHRWRSSGQSGLFGGGDLSQIADKRPAHFFATWLVDPASLNRHHRMPTFPLTPQEQGNLSAFLGSLKDEPPTSSVPAASAEQIARGMRRFEKHRCVACHAVSSQAPTKPSPVSTLSAESEWSRSCVHAPTPDGRRPGYQLSVADRQAVEVYVSGLLGADRVAETAGQDLVVEQNCLSCHARGLQPGLAHQLPALAAQHPELAPLVAAMAPPSLASVGDKFVDAALLSAIVQRSGNRRPWLAVRMPRFRLNARQSEAIQRHFITADRVPEQRPDEVEPTAPISPQLLALAGPRLVTPDGFGCTSCHQIGDVVPPAAPLNARGPDLTRLSQRIRRAWFDRFVPNPTRIVPRMEMPSVQVAVRGVLEDRLDRQLSAVWDVLNRPGFQPPQPNPVRVVRRTGVAEDEQPAVFLTDVLQVGEQQWIKPFAVGLSNRHNILFDLERAQLSSWRVGDVARQRTQGKTWFWEAAGIEVATTKLDGADLELLRDGETLQAIPQGQFLSELDAVEFIPGGLEFRYRLHFATAGAAKSDVGTTLRITQQLSARKGDSQQRRSGFRRTMSIAGCRENDRVTLRLLAVDPQAPLTLSPDGRSARLTGGQAWIRTAKPFGSTGVVTAIADARGTARFTVDYQTSLPVDRFPHQPQKRPNLEPLKLQVVPGFQATRLPVDQNLMPTGLAWRPNGSLVVTSLKGRVWTATDTDGDGLEDRFHPMGGEWAAPFGVAASDRFVDVINKWGLVRLFDQDQDGTVERVETLVSGWGHTADYHDWTVGLVKDRQGNYFVATSCQQDERADVAAHLRGMVLKLSPRAITPGRPQKFDIIPISGGHRFPIGIAQSRSGELFVTDNQGHYNPFNELNHIVSGARYGFIGRAERKPGFDPPLTPPAIDIPHPWTRSVNGICFLDAPKSAGEGRTATFGPFEGQLVGCEYDTRRLIRMSLQRVGDTMQGAAYPFSLSAPTTGEPLLGPLTCAVSPRGDLYVGCIRDSGWGGANNIGTLVRLRFEATRLPVGIAEVRAIRGGFEVEFTGPVERDLAGDVKRYALSSFTRASTPTYGGPDRDRRNETIQSIQVNGTARRVRIQLAAVREGYVYELHLQKLVAGDTPFFPDEAYYTLRKAVE